MDRRPISLPARSGPSTFETHFAPGMLDQAVLPDESLKLTFRDERAWKAIM